MRNPNKIKKIGVFDVFNVSWMVVFAFFCLLPIIIMISASFSTDTNLTLYGYTLLPKAWSVEAYRIVFKGGASLIRAYGVSILVTLIGTVLNLFLSAMIAYPLSKGKYKYKNWITYLLLVTMLFSPGTIPTYILITQFLQWKDTLWVMIIPQIGSTFNIILLRTFFVFPVFNCAFGNFH